MSNQSPSDIAREAKEKHSVLKELLRTKEPFDKEIDFPRKDLRRRYLSLLFLHPYAKESRDAETHLWMQTSYAFISEYKKRITHLDRLIQHQTQQPQPNQSRHGPHGPVEYRKLLQRFRQFLADEDKFWTQFVLRFQQTFALEEAKPILATLGIVSDDAEFAPDAEGSRYRRNHYQFPSSDHSTPLVPTSPDQRETRIAILGKALICLGDIARYRELYNESEGRPRAGHNEAPPPGGRRSRNRRGDQPKPRNYDKARLCYEQAKYLVPHEGNASHQLAILSNYSKDTFSSILHYYRALCLRQRYDTALENLNTTLQKFLEIQVKKNKEGVDSDVPRDIANVPKVRIELLKEKVVVLHALWRLGRKKNDASTRNQSDKIFSDFYGLIAEHHLPEELVIQIIVIAQGALWTHRMLRQPSGHRAERSNDEHGISRPANHLLSDSVIESRIYVHLLSFYRALLEVGIEALRDPPPMDAGNGEDSDLAQKIAVELRRILPALRIASKWLRANYSYCMSDPEVAGAGSDSEVNDENKSASPSISPASICTIEFWKQYAEFLRALSRTFPMDRLPTSVFPLKEDIEMRGWLPLKDTLDERFVDSGKSADETDDAPHEESEVHPNVVQLMRIKDLLTDGAAIVGFENSPLALYGKQFVLKGVEADVQPIPITSPNLDNLNGSNGDMRIKSASRPKKSPKPSKKRGQQRQNVYRNDPVSVSVEDEDIIAITSKNDDDVVRKAFEHLDHSDEEDEIVWNPRASPILPSPIAPPRSSVANMPSRSPVNSTIISSSSPIVPLSASPTRATVPPLNKSPLTVPNPPMRVAPTTAKDLLHGFMSLNTSRVTGGAESPRMLRKTSDPLQPPTTAPASTFLFGGDRPGNSIWSASQDELKFPAGPGISLGQQAFNHHHNLPASQDLTQSQSIWGSYSASTQMSQQQVPGGLPSAGFPAPPHPTSTDAFSVNPQHRRVPSASVAAQLFPNRNAQNATGFAGPFGYASPIPPLETTLATEPQNVFNTEYTDLNMQQSVHGNYYNSGVPITSSPNQGLHSPYVLPDRLNQSYMTSAWGRVG